MNEQFTQAVAQALQGEQADPLQALLMQQLAQSGNEAAEDESPLREELGRCRRTVRRLGAEVAAANAMTEWVAQVLGACPSCWGLNRFCRRCLGTGAPGSSQPDAERLVDWIGPALSAAGLSLIPAPSGNPGGSTTMEGAPHGNG